MSAMQQVAVVVANFRLGALAHTHTADLLAGVVCLLSLLNNWLTTE